MLYHQVIEQHFPVLRFVTRINIQISILSDPHSIWYMREQLAGRTYCTGATGSFYIIELLIEENPVQISFGLCGDIWLILIPENPYATG
jgi:hypothetical protein